MGVLARILEQKRVEIAALRHARLPAPPERRAVELRRRAGALSLIAEIKLRSPSAGALSARLAPAERARAYQRGGARMVSVLTDRDFFGGAWEHLAQARAACELPVLCKDFVLDEAQLDAARGWGADAVLLIVRCLSAKRLAALLEAARQRQLEALVEVASDAEARLALDAGAGIVGVNARDLDSLGVDVARARTILAGLPPSLVRVHLSGLASAADVRAVGATGADAALVGEALMREDDPRGLLEELVAAAGR